MGRTMKKQWEITIWLHGEVVLVVFILLKLTGVIQWSWVWVLSPLWIMSAVLVIGLTAVLVVSRINRKPRGRMNQRFNDRPPAGRYNDSGN